jgi:predicted dienelactone hydrolase
MRRTIALVLLTALAAVAGAADPAKTGRLAVGVTTVDAVDTSRARTLPTEIWYPARAPGRDREPLPRAYPLILVAHGFCGSRLNYDYLAPHLASWGFVVAAPDFTGETSADCDAGPATSLDQLPLDLSFVCRDLHDVSGPLGKYAQHVRGLATGLVGISLGGRAVFEAAKIDPSFTTVVGLAPAEFGVDEELATLAPRRALMVMGGTADTTVLFTTATQPFFDALPPPAYLVRITGGTHGGFGDAGSQLTPTALAAVMAQQTVVRRYATAFVFKYLARKPKFGHRLRPLDDGTVALTVRTK